MEHETMNWTVFAKGWMPIPSQL